MAQKQSLKINEIFHSIQGESSWVGYPTVFVRTSGCHLRCSYCDTTHAYFEGELMSHESVIEKVQEFSTPYICVTGGEPLLQPSIFEFLTKLCDLKFRVSLETSGDKDCARVDSRVKKIIDIKTPDSGAANAFDKNNLKFADRDTEFKFVICSEKDLKWAEEFSRANDLFEKSNVLYSPSFKIVDELWLAQTILAMRSPARMQLQLHKYIWPSDARGV